MAEKIEILVTSNGSTESETRKARELAKELKSAADAADLAARTAAKIESATATPRTRASRKKSALDDALGDDTETYRKQRGATGTGSAARDFSREATGLGGLVRIYATFAANIYALSTAFNLLGRAADTSNMVRGLEQLGAAGGKNLTGLAKQLVAATDGAISLKDAMAATAAGSAGGLSGDQLVRITNVAKTASQALGRDMPDALNRLTRGITKIEPELLDELGILVKVDMANQNYARSLGKTVNSLTDLEKRQAFANEAITQGEKKFKDIQMAANPYAKLSASLQNLTQSSLELVNKVLTPIVDILASSPTGLSLAILGLSSVLFKQAIPDVKAWRDSLKDAEIEASKTAIEASNRAKTLRNSNTTEAKKLLQQSIDDKKREVEEFVLAEKTKRDLAIKSAMPDAKVFKSKIEDNPDRATELLNLQIGAKKTAIVKANRELLLIDDEAARASKEKTIATNKAKVKSLEEALKIEEAMIQGKLDREAAISNLEVERTRLTETRKASVLSQLSADRSALKAKERLESIKILEVVSETSKAEGFRAAMSEASARTTASGLGKVAQATVLVKSGFIAAADAAKGIYAAIAPWLPLILAGFAVISYGADKLSGNSKEISKFDASLEGLEVSLKSVDAALESIANKGALSGLTVEAIQSRATAFSDLSAATKKVVKDLDAADRAATEFGKFFDQIKKVWGGDLRSKATDNVVKSLLDSLRVADGAIKETLTSNLTTILGTTDLTASGIQKSLDGIDSPDKLKEKFFALSRAQDQSSAASVKQSNALVNLRDKLSEVAKVAGDIITATLPTDNFSKYAIGVTTIAASMGDALNNTGNAYAAFIEITSKPGNLAAFSEDAAKRLLDEKAALDKLKDSVTELSAKEDKRNKAIKANKELEDSVKVGGKSTPRELSGSAKAEYEANVRFLELTKNNKLEIDKATDKLNKEAAESLRRGMLDAFDKGAELIQVALNLASREAALTISKAYASGLQGSGTADVMFKLKSEEIAIQKAQIEQELKLLMSQDAVQDKMEILATALNSNTLALNKNGIATEAKTAGGMNADMTNRLKGLEAEQNLLDASKKKQEQISAILQKARDAAKNGSAASYVDALAAEASAARTRATVSKSNEDAQIAIDLQSRYQKVLGAVGKLRTKDAELAAASISTELAKVKEVETKELKQLDVTKQRVDYSLALNKLAQATSPIFSKDLSTQQGVLEAEKVKLALAQENAKLKAVDAEFSIRQRSGEDLSTQKAEAKQAIELNIAKIKADAYIEEFNRLKAISDAKLAQQDREMAFAERMAVYRDNVTRSSLDVSLAELNAQQQLGTISAETAANVSFALAKQTEELQKQQELRQAEAEYNQKRSRSLEEFGNRDKVRTTPISAEEALAQTSELQKQTEEFNAQKLAINTKSAALVTGLDITKKTTIELEKQSKVIRLMDSISNSLTKAFGKIGTAIGTVGKTLVTSNKALVDLEAKKQREISDLRAGGLKQEEAEAKVRVKYATESASVSINAAADVAGAVAGSFNEQSGAARAFYALEKAFHIAKLAMDVQAMVSATTVAATQVTTAGATATAWIPAIWARAFGEGGPYLGWALGAAALAMVGKAATGSKKPSGPTSEQLKEVQGTGQTYDAKGNKVSTGYGVLGDDTAKSESIVKSLEFIEKYTFEELEYSNQMLAALKSIDLGINGIARGVARTGGLISGTGFGTLEGNFKGPLDRLLGTSLLGAFASSIFGGRTSTSITGSGIKLGGTVGGIASGTDLAAQYETGTTTTKGGWFTSDKTRGFTNTKSIQDEAFNKAISDSFQGISKALVEAGTAIGLDSKQLSYSIAQIPIDLSVETRGLKGSEISDAISAVLSNTADMLANKVLAIVKPFQVLNEGLAETAIRVARSSQVIDLQLKSVGMSFKAVGVDSINARMGLIELSGGLEQFISDSNFFKANFLTEAERLAPIQKSVTDELNRLGYAGLNTREAFKELVLSLDLADAAQASLYTSLMKLQKGFAAVYKEADDTTSKLETVRNEQSARVLNLLATKEQQLTIARNKELASLDPSLRAMQSWIYALEDEADAREALVAAYDAEASARQNTIDSLKSSIDTLKQFSLSLALGENSPLTPEQKYATAKTSYEQLKTTLSSSTATTDEKIKALEELPNSITQLLETSKVFYASSEQYQKDYADAQATLALKIADSKTQLTIEERSLKELETQVGLLGKIDSSVLSVADALAKYNAAVSASNAAGVAAGVGSAGSTIGGATSATNQKDYISTLLTGWYANHPYLKRAPDAAGLEYWKKDILSGKSLQEVKASFTAAASENSNKMPIISIDAFAKGGYMKGLSLVGEEGPELVNFSNPGQVYTNGQTGNILGSFTDSIAREIAALKAEIANLKESNRVDAAFVAAAVANAAQANAEKVGESIKDSVGTNNWDTSRNQGVKL